MVVEVKRYLYKIMVVSMLKDWFLIACVSYGAGFSSTFFISRSLSQSAWGGLGTIPAVAVTLTALARQRRQEIERQIAGTKLRLQEVEKKEQFVEQQFQAHSARSKELFQKLESAQADLAECTSRLLRQQKDSRSLKQDIFDLQQEHKTQQTYSEAVTSATTALHIERQALEKVLSNLRQLEIAEQQKSREISSSIIALKREEEAVKIEVDRLTKLQSQQQTALATAEQSAREKHRQEQQIQLLLAQKMAEIDQQHRQQKDLLSQLELEIGQKQETARTAEEQLAQAQERLRQLSLSTKSEIVDPETLARRKGLYRRDELIDRPHDFASSNAQNFANPRYAKKIWEEQILPHWLDRDKPKGQRFLGNVNISREQSEELMSLIGESLRPPNPSIKNINGYRKFLKSNQDWIKVFTFALSEYAYYYSDDRFWEGFCYKWLLPYNQGVENTLRNITERGIKLLDLVETNSTNKYVSTMWLQSGIPYRNLDQFAQLVKDLSSKYEWYDLAQSSAEDLVEKMLVTHDYKYQRGTLFGLLKHPQTVSGKIVRSIAMIANAMKDGRINLSVLSDEAKREEALSHLDLDNDFFIRDWEAVIKILEPKALQKKHLSTQKGSAEAFLRLDVEDSENIQLVLPAQNIWDDQWIELRGNSCSIPIAQWRSYLNMQGDLNIPECIIDVTQLQQVCDIELVSDRGDVLYTWPYATIENVLPHLIFDAFSGSHLPTENDELVTDSTEIVCFVPTFVKVTAESDASLLEDGIPCSIKGWKGTRLELKSDRTVIRLQPTDNFSGRSIQWQLLINNEPRLAGLSLSNKLNYFEMPMLWLPPDSGFERGEVKVRRVENDEEIHAERFDQKAIKSEKWQCVTLSSANPVIGEYRVDVSTESLAWSRKFTIKPQYTVISITMELPRIYIDGQSLADKSLPYICFESYEFNAKIIGIQGLWALESIDLILMSEFGSIRQISAQAGQQGSCEIRMSELSEFWDQSADWYELSYRRRSQQPVRLLRKESAVNRFASN
jgi:hypothetical protein